MEGRGAKQKNEYIETLRGLAILLVVVGHVIGIDSAGAMKVPDDSGWRYVYFSFIQFIQMPLFTAIAGWVYAYRPVCPGRYAAFSLRKASRLLLPMIFVGTLYFLVQYLTPGTNARGDLSEIWRIYVFPYTVYWYLPALFLIFLLVGWADTASRASDLRSWTLLLLLSVGAAVAGNQLAERLPNPFAVWNAMCLLPYFVLGVGMHRFPGELASQAMRRVYLIGFFASLVLLQTVWFTAGNSPLVRSLYLNIPIGLLVSACLMTLRWRNRLLTYLGSYAYTIYLFHAFGTSAGRILMVRAGINSNFAIFALALLLGLGLPILADKLFSRFRPTALLLLGKPVKSCERKGPLKDIER